MTSLYILLIVAAASVIWASSSEHELIAELVENYPEYKDARPLMDSSQAVPLQLEYVFNNIVDFDEENALLGVHGWLRERWIDEYMTWDNNETGIEALRISKDHCWHPDVQAYQSVDEKFAANIKVIVWPNGRMTHVPPCFHRIQCEKGDAHYTFDCRLNLGSWTYHKDLVHLTLWDNSAGVNTMYFHEHPRWNVETQAEITERICDCCPDHPHQSLQVDFTITRK